MTTVNKLKILRNKYDVLIFVIEFIWEEGYIYILKFLKMRATIQTNESKGNTTEKLVKIIDGKGYLEVLMYLIGISASIVILFG